MNERQCTEALKELTAAGRRFRGDICSDNNVNDKTSSSAICGELDQ